MDFCPLSRTSDLVIQTSGDEILVYDLESNKAFCLNEASAIVWNLCNGSHSVTEISAEMSKRMKSVIDEDFVLLALDQLNKDGLLEEGIELNNRFAGFSRREIIRRVGFASAIALPLVSSVVAPEVLMAQSCGMVGSEPCTSGSCCTGLFCAPTFDNVFGGIATPAGDFCCVATNSRFSPGSTYCTFVPGPTCAGLPGFCCSGIQNPAPTNPACGTSASCICG